MAHFCKHNLSGSYVPRSQSYEGRFGRLFRETAWVPPGNSDEEREQLITNFVNEHMFNPEGQDDPSDNSNLPAGYTYFGQFVDHDITFDPTSSLARRNDPDSLNNFRTPRLDLDCVYGAGPDDQPYMYDNDRAGPGGFKGFLLIGEGQKAKEPDLPRNTQGRALIGDMRNDENVIVSQIQLGFLKLHNRVLENIAGPGNGASKDQFEEAQRIVRWFYQYIVWNDFIKRLVADTVWSDALKRDGHEWKANDRFYKPKHSAFMPVEFSVAAYRFGHSLIRPDYKVSNIVESGGQVGFPVDLPIFDPTHTGQPDLGGFGTLKPLHMIQWDWFLQFPSSAGPFPQPSQLIDRTLSRGVFHIDAGQGLTNPLAFLNIVRGWRMELPSGPDVARAMGLTPITLEHEHENSLWVYMLREAEKLPGSNQGKQMGAVGGTIMAHVFAGLLKKDDMSYFNMAPDWTPNDAKDELGLGDNPVNGGDWEFADLIRAAGLPEDEAQVRNFVEGQDF